MKKRGADGRPVTRGTREASEEGVYVHVKPTTANRRVIKTPTERRSGRRALEESDACDADERSANVRANACLPARTFECTTRETSQAVERRPGQILERHDMAEDSIRQGHLETAC